MADFEFEITSGPYVGRYELDLADFTAADSNAFRHAVGISLAHVVNGGDADIDAVAGLVWLTRRRSGAAKGLPYAAVAEHVTYANVEPFAEQAEGESGGSLDPTTPSPSAAD